MLPRSARPAAADPSDPMTLLEQLLLDRFLLFTFVLARVGGLIAIAPIFGGRSVPIRIRAYLAVAIAALITPLQSAALFDEPKALPAYAVIMAGELIVGLLLGLGVKILFTGIQLAGQIISQLSGMALADVIQPGFDIRVPVMSQFLLYVTMAAFVILGGHRMVMAALLDTYQAMPPGGGGLSRPAVDMLVTIVTQSFVLGIRAAAPTMTALLLSTLVMGLISRTLPQINILAVGFGLNAMIALGLLALSLGAVTWMFQGEMETMLDQLLGAMASGAA